MGYNHSFYTRNKDLQRYIDCLMKDFYVEMPPRYAQELSRHKTIRTIRNMDYRNPSLIIANDTKLQRSIVKIKKPLIIKKIGDKYIFSFSL